MNNQIEGKQPMTLNNRVYALRNVYGHKCTAYVYRQVGNRFTPQQVDIDQALYDAYLADNRHAVCGSHFCDYAEWMVFDANEQTPDFDEWTAAVADTQAAFLEAARGW